MLGMRANFPPCWRRCVIDQYSYSWTPTCGLSYNKSINYLTIYSSAIRSILMNTMLDFCPSRNGPSFAHNEENGAGHVAEVRKQNGKMITSCLLGVFKENFASRTEFFSLLGSQCVREFYFTSKRQEGFGPVMQCALTDVPIISASNDSASRHASG